jgi:hypothetical protein
MYLCMCVGVEHGKRKFNIDILVRSNCSLAQPPRNEGLQIKLHVLLTSTPSDQLHAIATEHPEEGILLVRRTLDPQRRSRRDEE